MSGPDYILDIQGLAQPQSGDRADEVREARPWISVYWKCCKTYSRVYRNAQATMYVGHCPKCAKPVRAKIGAEGVSTRFFQAE